MSYPPFPFSFLAWFAFVPLLVGLRAERSARSAFVHAYIALLVTFALAFHWPLLHEMRSTALLSLPPLLIIPMWMAIPFGLAHAVKRRHGDGTGMCAWVVLTILAEYGLRAGPLAFPWTLIGHTQAVATPVNALAALGGVPLLTLVVLLANAAIYLSIRHWLRRGGSSIASVSIAVILGCVIAVVTLFYGVGNAGSDVDMRADDRAGTAGMRTGDPARAAGMRAGDRGPAAGGVTHPADAPPGVGGRSTRGVDQATHVASPVSHASDTPMRVAGVQPALSPLEWADLADSSRVTLLLRLSQGAASSDSTIQLIIWPETAVPPRPASRPYFDRMQAFVDSAGIPILAGAITTGNNGAAYRNTAVFLAPGASPGMYHKINLVPFAEHVPFSGASSIVDRLTVPSGGVAGYEPGENRRIFEIPRLRFGVLICFETLFAGASRSYALADADVLVAITQDGWWGDSFGYRQHLAFNRLRAIETGRPMIQSAVSGISALIRPDGRVDELAGWMERAVWTTDVPSPADPPPYVRLGDWVTLLAACLAGAAAVFLAIRFLYVQRTQTRRHAT